MRSKIMSFTIFFYSINLLSWRTTNQTKKIESIKKLLGINYEETQNSIQKKFNENWNNLIMKHNKENFKRKRAREIETIYHETKDKKLKIDKIDFSNYSGSAEQIEEKIEAVIYLQTLQTLESIIRLESLKRNRNTNSLNCLYNDINRLKKVSTFTINKFFILKFTNKNNLSNLENDLVLINNSILDLEEEDSLIEKVINYYDNLKISHSVDSKNFIYKAIKYHINTKEERTEPEVEKNSEDHMSNKNKEESSKSTDINNYRIINTILQYNYSEYFRKLVNRRYSIQDCIQNYLYIAKKILKNIYVLNKDNVNSAFKNTITSLAENAKEINKLEEEKNINHDLTQTINDYDCHHGNDNKKDTHLNLVIDRLVNSLTTTLKDIVPINQKLDQESFELLNNRLNNFYNKVEKKINLLNATSFSDIITLLRENEKIFVNLTGFYNDCIDIINDIKKEIQFKKTECIENIKICLGQRLLNFTDKHIKNLEQKYNFLSKYKVICEYLVNDLIKAIKDLMKKTDFRNTDNLLNNFAEIYENKIEEIFLLKEISLIKQEAKSINLKFIQKDLQKICQQKRSKTIILLQQVIDSQENFTTNFFSNSLVTKYQEEEKKINKDIISGINILDATLNTSFDLRSISLISQATNKLNYLISKCLILGLEDTPRNKELLKLINEFCEIEKNEIISFKKNFLKQKLLNLCLQKRLRSTPLNIGQNILSYQFIEHVAESLNSINFESKNTNFNECFFERLDHLVLEKIIPSYTKMNTIFSNRTEEIVNKILKSDCVNILNYVYIKKQYYDVSKNSENIINELYKNCPIMFVELVFDDSFKKFTQSKFSIKSTDKILDDTLNQIFNSNQKLLKKTFEELSTELKKINDHSDTNIITNCDKLVIQFKELYQNIKHESNYVKLFKQKLIEMRMKFLQEKKDFYSLFIFINEIWHNYGSIPKLLNEEKFIQEFLEVMKNNLMIIEAQYMKHIILENFNYDKFEFILENFDDLKCFCFFASEITKLKLEIKSIITEENSEIKNINSAINNFDEINKMFSKK